MRTASFACLLSLLIACGNSTAPDGGSADDGGGGSEDAGSGTDAGFAGPPEGVLRTSRVFAVNYDFGGLTDGLAGAQFFDQDPAPLAFTEENLGGGCALLGAEFLIEPGTGGLPSYRDAGAIEVSGGRADLTITRGVFYEAVTQDTPLWDEGDTLTVTAPGGVDVGAFATTLPAPTHVTVTAPPLPLGGAPDLVVERSAGLTLTWTGSTSGEDVLVRIDGPSSDAVGEVAPSVECRFDPAAGTGTVPAAILGRLPAGSGVLLVDVVSERRLRATGWGAVNVELSASAVWATGNRYVAGVELR